MDVLSDPVPKKADAKQGAALRMVHGQQQAEAYEAGT